MLMAQMGIKPFFLGGKTTGMPEKIENIIVHGLNCKNNSSFFFVFSSPLRNNYSIHAQLGVAYKDSLIIHEHQS